jgi:hypothetical protein
MQLKGFNVVDVVSPREGSLNGACVTNQLPILGVRESCMPEWTILDGDWELQFIMPSFWKRFNAQQQ